MNPSRLPDAAFAALIERLRDGGETPARVYERLRERLLALFRVYLPAEAEALTDVALDRLAKRVAEGVQIDDLRLYALGIARMVLREGRLRLARQHLAERDPTLQPDAGDAAAERLESEADLHGLRACLEQLDRPARDLILAYYGADGGARIRLRQRLADAQGSTLNALRNRALRLRERIERCLRERFAREGRP